MHVVDKNATVTLKVALPNK